ncbi:MAG TPA: DUF5615 family PIN-like protein [Tepidisphaeraceae bacterium]|jgi:hypothetical protein
MLALLADENLSQVIIAGVLRRRPDADLITVRDAGLAAGNDLQILQWAAEHNRVILTHDLNTMIHFAYERTRAGQRMTGVFAIPQNSPIKPVIEDLILLLECSELSEWENEVLFLPM